MKQKLNTFTFFCANMHEIDLMSCNDLPKAYKKNNIHVNKISCQDTNAKKAYKRLVDFAKDDDKIYFTFEDHLSVMTEGEVEDNKQLFNSWKI
jgi:hypothetical protein